MAQFHVTTAILLFALVAMDSIWFCSAEFWCPDVGQNPVNEYIGRGIKLSDVVACAEVNRNKSLVSIQSFDNVTVDVDYPNFGVSSIEPSILIVTPKLIVEGNFTFNLNGSNGKPAPAKPPGNGTTNGKPGAPGNTAGSFLVAFNETNKGWNIDWFINGGDGGNGQAGQDAPNGREGEVQQVRERNERDCSAWSGGWVKVKKVPNICYERMDDQGRCYADDNGARIDVFGTYGDPGFNGTDGGSRGTGGNRGVGLMALLSLGINNTFRGDKGKEGNDGIAGNPGRGGRKGDTNELVIDDYGNIIEGKWCKILSQTYVPVDEFAREGYPGLDGGNCCSLQPTSTFELEDFRSHLQNYFMRCVVEALDVGDNVLLRFCDNVRHYFDLDL